MASAFNTVALRRAARLGIVGLALLGAVRGAAAEDGGGIQQFFQSMFGGQQATAPSYVQPVDAAPTVAARGRPLTVRLHRPKPKTVIAQRPAKPGKVSIYADRTLRRGDAVMMADGIRVFAGSASWPYVDSDFVTLAEARGMTRATGKVLAAIDRVPRG